jgi:hypothetical protein
VGKKVPAIAAGLWSTVEAHTCVLYFCLCRFLVISDGLTEDSSISDGETDPLPSRVLSLWPSFPFQDVTIYARWKIQHQKIDNFEQDFYCAPKTKQMPRFAGLRVTNSSSGPLKTMVSRVNFTSILQFLSSSISLIGQHFLIDTTWNYTSASQSSVPLLCLHCCEGTRLTPQRIHFFVAEALSNSSVELLEA